MLAILNNPYRTVGLLAGAKAKEQERQVRRLKQFIDAEQDPDDDFSFPVFGDLSRTISCVEDASSKLNLDSDKVHAAMFWFWNGNDITDEAAFDSLKQGDVETAFQIWDKLITTTNDEGKRFWKPVTEKNHSAFHNVFVISFLKEKGNLQNAIAGNLYFLESELVHKFISAVSDETYKPSKKDLQLTFLNQLLIEIEKSSRLSVAKFIEIISKQNFSAKDEFVSDFSKKLIEQIEKKIEESRNIRKNNKLESSKIANELHVETKVSILQLKSLIETSNIRYSSIADKLAIELFACGRDHFMHYRDTSTDPGESTMAIFNNARRLAIGNIAQQKIDENIKNLEDWIREKPIREKHQIIMNEVQFIEELIEKFKNEDVLPKARELIQLSLPALQKIKSNTGADDQLLIGLSTKIASISLGICINMINSNQEAYLQYRNSEHLNLFIGWISISQEIIITIESFDLSTEFRSHLFKNKQSILELRNSLSTINKNKKFNSSGGCYVATMAYGDYDHPQVIILRQYRDEVLAKSTFGKWFIKSYYHYSPMFVEKFKNKKGINTIIRKTLNVFIKIIEK